MHALIGDGSVILNLLDFDGGFRKEPDGLPAFHPACPHDVAQVRMTMETLVAKRNAADRLRGRT